jgi:hypothetical protein
MVTRDLGSTITKDTISTTQVERALRARLGCGDGTVTPQNQFVVAPLKIPSLGGVARSAGVGWFPNPLEVPPFPGGHFSPNVARQIGMKSPPLKKGFRGGLHQASSKVANSIPKLAQLECCFTGKQGFSAEFVFDSKQLVVLCDTVGSAG